MFVLIFTFLIWQLALGIYNDQNSQTCRLFSKTLDQTGVCLKTFNGVDSLLLLSSSASAAAATAVALAGSRRASAAVVVVVVVVVE